MNDTCSTITPEQNLQDLRENYSKVIRERDFYKRAVALAKQHIAYGRIDQASDVLAFAMKRERIYAVLPDADSYDF